MALGDADRARYEWQLWVEGFSEQGQERLKNATALVSRVGGVGGAAAQQLAAAGIGRLILAHAGNLRSSDLNRQILMEHAGLEKPRIEQAARRLRQFNPDLQIDAVAENISADNVDRLVAKADIVVGCAPLFQERLWLNAAAVRHGKPYVDCAMFELELQLFTVLRGGPCLACLMPEPPAEWKRQFPVFGAVAGTVGSLGAMEAIKVLAGLGEPLRGAMLLGDLRTMDFRKVTVAARPNCPVCGPGGTALPKG